MLPNGFYVFHLVVAKVFSQMLQVVYGESILVMSGVCVCVMMVVVLTISHCRADSLSINMSPEAPSRPPHTHSPHTLTMHTPNTPPHTHTHTMHTPHTPHTLTTHICVAKTDPLPCLCGGYLQQQGVGRMAAKVKKWQGHRDRHLPNRACDPWTILPLHQWILLG